ncbi:hypothetical protein V8C37DRAFT_138895 [Trichoderma ceciliae]
MFWLFLPRLRLRKKMEREVTEPGGVAGARHRFDQLLVNLPKACGITRARVTAYSFSDGCHSGNERKNKPRTVGSIKRRVRRIGRRNRGDDSKGMKRASEVSKLQERKKRLREEERRREERTRIGLDSFRAFVLVRLWHLYSVPPQTAPTSFRASGFRLQGSHIVQVRVGFEVQIRDSR